MVFTAMTTRTACRTFKSTMVHLQTRSVSSASGPRHLLSIADLSPAEFSKLVLNASSHKTAVKAAFAAGQVPPKPLHGALTGKTVAMMFNKRSTRTRVSTEAAVQMMSGHPMFLGKDDIQLGVCLTPSVTPPLLSDTYL
jgi:ornithine carbamoyltransferase